MGRDRSEGFAMLAVLVVMVLAATFALVVVGAVHSLQLVEASDAASWRAAAAEGPALAEVTRALRWRPSVTAGTASGGDSSRAGSWDAAWQAAPVEAGAVWPRVGVRVVARAGAATHRDDSTFELRREPWATGVTCAGDADIDQPFVVSGSGLYVGGCLRGRENVSFGGEVLTPQGLPADEVRGDVFPVAAVHGGAGIFARGVELHHAAAGGEFPDDTDQHSGPPAVARWLDGPSAGFLLAAAIEAPGPGTALDDGCLHLDAIGPPVGAEASGGRCLLLPASGEVAIEGALAPQAGRVLIVVQGDASVGRPGETVVLNGGLVVCGHLEVRGGLVLSGTLHAAGLSIEAPVSVDVPDGWCRTPLSGAILPTLVEHGDWS